MKKVTFFLLAMIASLGLFSQTVLMTENMDSYAVNSFLAVNNPTWFDTWSGTPGSGEDAEILNNFSHSGTNSASADVVGGTTDCILKLGDRTTGKYEVTWWMYVENNKCGYYNFQHFESPGIEWAFEIYFRTAGTIELQVGGNTINGTYPKAQWFECKHIINLDADSIYLYINGTMLSAWPFSWEASSQLGTNQLGGVDLFAGAASGTTETPGFYFDDVYFAELVTGATATINVDPTSIEQWVMQGGTDMGMMTVSNTGTGDLNYTINTIYDLDAFKSAQASPEVPGPCTVKKVLSNIQSDPTPNPGTGPAQTDATAILHYDGDPYTAIGWNTPPVTVTVAARFPNSFILPYAGLDIVSVDVYINELNTSGSNQMTVKIFGMKDQYEPGPVLATKTFTPTAGDWTTVTLTTPVKITGQDIWVGYTFTQTDASIYIPGCDAGPADPNGDYLSTGVGWSHLAPNLDYNWNIRANCSGNYAAQWLDVTPKMGTVMPNESEDLTLDYDATTLDPGTYDATLRFISNDPVNDMVDVPVTMHVAGVGINEHANSAVLVYPNPGKDVLHIVTKDNIKNVKMIDYNGKVVYSGNASVINISDFSTGVYFVNVITENATHSIKFVKK